MSSDQLSMIDLSIADGEPIEITVPTGSDQPLMIDGHLNCSPMTADPRSNGQRSAFNDRPSHTPPAQTTLRHQPSMIDQRVIGYAIQGTPSSNR